MPGNAIPDDRPGHLPRARPASRRLPRPRSRSRRRIAAASWAAPSEGLVQGFLDLDVTLAERWCTRHAVTLAQLAGCAVGHGLVAAPDVRSRVVGGRIVPRASADVSFTVTMGLGADLRAVCIRDIDCKHPRAVAAELQGGARRILRGDDPLAGRAVAIADRLPAPLLRPALRLAGLLANGVGLRLPLARVEPHSFGSAIVTAVEVFGLRRGLAPLVPLARVSTVVCVGTPYDRVEPHGVARVVELGLTFDHRIVDGAQIATFTQRVRQVMERPWEEWGGPEPLRAVAVEPEPAPVRAAARAV